MLFLTHERRAWRESSPLEKRRLELAPCEQSSFLGQPGYPPKAPHFRSLSLSHVSKNTQALYVDGLGPHPAFQEGAFPPIRLLSSPTG